MGSEEDSCSKRIKFDEAFEIAGVNSKKRTMYRCRYCFKFPSLVKMGAGTYQGKIPGLCTEKGVIPVYRDLETHLKKDYHQECVKACILHSVAPDDRRKQSRMGLIISRENQKLAQIIGQHLLDVYNDAKRGTLSAHSWPSRKVAQQIGMVLDLSKDFTPYQPSSDLMYVNPVNHAMFLDLIVSTDLERTKALLEDAISVSIRVDGSVDRYRVDNKFVMAKVVSKDGSDHLVFLGFEEPLERKAKGYYEAVRKACEWIMPWENLFANVSSVCTDGENLNTGEKSSLWALLDSERNNTQQSIAPLIKIWCAAHRSNLAYKALLEAVPEAEKIVSAATDLATFFHKSSIRTSELRQIAQRDCLKVLQLPKTFEVRFSQFTAQLLEACLASWPAIMIYLSELDNPADKAAREGFLTIWTERNFLHCCCVLRDVLNLYSRFQKRLQSDKLLLSDVTNAVNDLCQRLDEVSANPTGNLGGWEERFVTGITAVEIDGGGGFEWQGITLDRAIRKTRGRGKIVTSVIETRQEIFAELQRFLIERMHGDAQLRRAILPLEKLMADVTDSDLRELHRAVIPDYDLETFAETYREVAKVFPSTGTREALNISVKNPQWNSLSVALSRAIGATPHSCDVERLISAYNLLKSPLRSSLSSSTIRNFLYLSINMPDLANFDVRPSIRQFLTEKSRRPHVNPPAKDCEYYVGVFPEATAKLQE